MSLRDVLPKNCSYPLYRYIEEAARITNVGAAIMKGVEEYAVAVEGEKIDDRRVVYAVRMAEEIVFQRVIDNFQTYVVDILAEIFSSRPEMIPGGQIDRRLLFESESLDEIRIKAVEDLLRSYGFKNVLELSDLLNTRFSFPLFTIKQDRQLVSEMITVRNLIVHNRGMSGYRYRSDFSRGKRIRGNEIAIPNGIETLTVLTRIVADVDTRATHKFNLEHVPPIA